MGCELSRQLSEPAGSFGSIVREGVEELPVVFRSLGACYIRRRTLRKPRYIMAARQGGESRQNGEHIAD